MNMENFSVHTQLYIYLYTSTFAYTIAPNIIYYIGIYNYRLDTIACTYDNSARCSRGGGYIMLVGI